MTSWVVALWTKRTVTIDIWNWKIALKRSLRDKRLEGKEKKQGFIEKTAPGPSASRERCEVVIERKKVAI